MYSNTLAQFLPVRGCFFCVKKYIDKKRLFFLLFCLSPGFLYAQNTMLSGVVKERNSGDPVPFATLVVKGNETKNTTTDENGKFYFQNLKPGYVRLLIFASGYKSAESEDILLSNHISPNIEVELEQDIQEIKEVLVKQNKFEKQSDALLSVHNIGIREIENNPGSNRDIAGVIRSLPGVGSTPAFRNDLIIRGGGPSENRFFLDGIEIPILNHFSTQGASGGPAGIINADFIKNVNYYSGSFPADKYNALSAVFDFLLKDGDKNKNHLQASLGASEAGLTLDGPLGKKSSYIFSLRRSYLQLLFKAIQLPFLPTFNDYQLKYKAEINNHNQLTIISLGSLDFLKLNTGIKNPTVAQKYILAKIPINNQWSYTIGANYRYRNKSGVHYFIASRNMLNNKLFKYPDNDENQAKIFDYTSQEAENKFRYIYDFQYKNYKYKVSAGVEHASSQTEIEKQIFHAGSLDNQSYISKLILYKYGLSARVSKAYFAKKLLMTLGVRMDGNTYNTSMRNLFKQFSPRYSLSFSPAENIRLNAGIGRYFQLPAYTTMSFKNNEGVFVNRPDLSYIEARHLNLGVEYNRKRRLFFSLEGFYKKYVHYPVSIATGASIANQGAGYEIAGAEKVIPQGKGYAVGAEFLNRIELSDFHSILSYTFVRSFFTDIHDTYIPSGWDSQHLLTITAAKDFKYNWQLGLKWRFVGGLPYTPYDLDKSAYIAAWRVKGEAYRDYSRLNSKRLSPFHQLDLRLEKRFFFQKWMLALYVDIQNAYNFKGKGQDYILRRRNPDGSFQTDATGLKYILKREPNQTGTLLPSIGIVVKI